MRLLSDHVTGVTVSVRSLYSYNTAATVICGLCKVCLRTSIFKIFECSFCVNISLGQSSCFSIKTLA